MLARTIMVQGTTSSAGKSLLVTALCRIFKQAGLSVAPFKSQNMALNSFVTPDSGEIGRAQAVQAEACGIPCSVDMNPILLKPEANSISQVVVLGKSVGKMSFREYHAYKPELRNLIVESLTRLRQRHDLVVIEGAGSPAEINLKEHEIVNMFVAKAADAPVLLVGDIDRGGVFAAFVGTLELLEPDERARIAAFVVNKFRGDVSLLEPGLKYLTGRTGVPVLGVVPYVEQLRIADEDSLSLEDRMKRRKPGQEKLDIVVIRLPRISNYDDFEALEHEPNVVVRFVERAEFVNDADLVILPGSKSTVSDLSWLRSNGFASVIEERVRLSRPVLGICGGCQMLGQSIDDPHGAESSEKHVSALGHLPLNTRFEREKLTAQVAARVSGDCFLTRGLSPETMLSGYEIHMGMIETLGPSDSPFRIVARGGSPVSAADGAIARGGSVVGTMIHGLFENAPVRQSMLRFLRTRRGLDNVPSGVVVPSKEDEYDRLAAAVRGSIDFNMLCQIAKINL